MKKVSLRSLPIVFLMMFVIGCGVKSSSLEGKAVDGEGQSLANVVEISDSKVYRVRMKTRFVVPSSGIRIDELRVWHALPTKKEWSGSDTQVGGSQISWIPKTGQKQYEKSHDSHHVLWDQTNLTPGSNLSFESEFTVHSPVRKFNPKTAPTSWKDYSTSSLPDYDKRQNIHFELIQIADRIRTANTPPAAVLEFNKWLSS